MIVAPDFSKVRPEKIPGPHLQGDGLPTRTRTWTCQRSTKGVVCKHKNPARNRKCLKCGKTRPPRKRPEHMKALDLPYEHYIEINGGEHCGICGARPKPHRRLDRDHDHKTGKARGLLCHSCNRTLKHSVTIAWMWAAIAYLRRADRR